MTGTAPPAAAPPSFYGTGEEVETLRFPAGYGYRVHAGDRWSTGWLLMNHTNRPETAYIEYTATIDTSSQLRHLTPYWLRATGCPHLGGWDPIFDVPGGGRRGSTYRRSIVFRMPRAGLLVAAGAHAHGGNKAMSISQPGCGGRRLLSSRPLYGRADHPYYHVLPVLHEPGPMDVSWLRTASGIPVGKGERLRVTAAYDNHHPHTRVMGIMHLYVAHDVPVHPGCTALPADLTNERKQYAGRTRAKYVRVPLTRLGRDGRAHRVRKPPGRLRRLRGPARVVVRRFAFRPANLSVAVGARVRWRFRDLTRHNVTLADGPVGFSSQNQRKGRSWSRRLTRPGTYKIFCSLHPVTMNQRIVVRPQPLVAFATLETRRRAGGSWLHFPARESGTSGALG